MTNSTILLAAVLGIATGAWASANTQTGGDEETRVLPESSDEPNSDSAARFRAVIERVEARRIHGLTEEFLDLKASTDEPIASAAAWLESTVLGRLPASNFEELVKVLDALPKPLADDARATMLTETGNAAIARMELGLASTCLEALEALALERGDWRLHFEADLLSGMRALLENDNLSARAKFEGARALAERNADSLRLARASMETGRILFLIGDHAGARGEYERAVPLLESNEAYFELVQALRFLAQAIASLGDVSSAIPPCARAVRMALTHGWTSQELDSRRIHVLLLVGAGELETARSELADYAGRAAELESKLHQAIVEREYATLDFSQDRLEAARDRLEHALELSEQCGDTSGAGECRMRLAMIAARLGDSIAMEFHANALLGDRPEATWSSLDLTLLLYRAEARSELGDHVAALEDLRRALAFAGERGELDRLCDGLRIRAQLHEDLGDHDAALADALESARVGEQIDDVLAIAAGRILAAQIRLDARDDSGAAADLDAAEPLVESLRGTLFERSDFEGHIALARSGIAFRAGQFELAAELAHRAAEIASKNGYADIERMSMLLGAGIELELHERSEGEPKARHLTTAQELATAALASADRSGSAQLRISPLAMLADCALLRGDLVAARLLTNDALATLDQFAGEATSSAFGIEIASRSRSGYARLFAFTQDLVVAEVEAARRARDPPEEITRRIEAGFSHAASFQGRALLEGIVEHRVGKRNRKVEALRREIAEIDSRRERALRRAAEALRAGEIEISAKERAAADGFHAERNAAAERLRSAEPGRSALLDPPAVTIEALRTLGNIGTDRALVTYVVGRSRTFAYVVSSRETALLDLVATDDLEARIATFTRDIADAESLGGPRAVAASGRRVADAILDPVLALLAPETTGLVIVPSETLASVPFEALVLAETRDPASISGFQDIAFVLDRFDVRYSPSAAVLIELAGTKSNQNTRKVCVFADSAAAFGFPSLGNAITEGERVASRFDRAVRYFDEAATSRALRADLREYSVLHFASHALAFADPPLSPGLVLRGELGESAIFGVGEVLELDLDADLVVLSACSTSAGATRPGEGVESLARAFLFAGARNVIASVFALSDDAALATVDHFYGRWVHGDTDAATALLATKRAIRRGEIEIKEGGATRGVGAVRSSPRGVPSGHPFHWAPLVIIGK